MRSRFIKSQSTAGLTLIEMAIVLVVIGLIVGGVLVGQDLIRAAETRAGITGAMASPKGLRHGFAIACIAKSIPLPTIQKWMGHARLETTAIYLGVSGDEERNLARRIW